MKGLYKRIIAGAFSLVTLFFACVPPAHASGLEAVTSIPVDFFTYIRDLGVQNVNFWKNLFDEDVCPESTSISGLHNFKEQRTTVDGKTSLYYICEYCGKSAGEVGEESYQQQVSTLPASGISSAGKLIWQSSVSDIGRYFSVVCGPSVYYEASIASFPWHGSSGYLSGVEFDVVSSGSALSFSYSGDRSLTFAGFKYA